MLGADGWIEFSILLTRRLHGRPANQFIKIAKAFASEIRVYDGRQDVNGKSILDLILLNAKAGTNLSVRIKGGDAEAAIVALQGLAAKVPKCPAGRTCRRMLGVRRVVCGAPGGPRMPTEQVRQHKRNF